MLLQFSMTPGGWWQSVEVVFSASEHKPYPAVAQKCVVLERCDGRV